MRKFNSPKEVEEITQTTQKVLVIYENDVYDLTKFLYDHPGGASIIEDYNGMDISEVFHDEDIHEHSESALKMLYPFKIGEIIDEDEDDDKNLKRSNNNDVVYPKISTESVKYKNFEISLNRGLIGQIYNLKKEDYEDFIDHPIHLPYCRLYDNPLMEFTTRNKWYNIPIFWTPVILYMAYNGIFYDFQEPSVMKPYVFRGGEHFSYLHVFFSLFLGVIFWSKFEYVLHRFLFHCNWWLPDIRIFLHAHFLLHGIHHAIPMDPDRLVFPPILGVIVYTATYYTWTFFLAGNFARLYLAGFLCGYVGYDLTHYYIHHGSPRSGHFSEMKTYHNKHHYKVAYAGYGITSKFWDYVWGTEIPE